MKMSRIAIVALIVNVIITMFNVNLAEDTKAICTAMMWAVIAIYAAIQERKKKKK